MICDGQGEARFKAIRPTYATSIPEPKHWMDLRTGRNPQPHTLLPSFVRAFMERYHARVEANG